MASRAALEVAAGMIPEVLAAVEPGALVVRALSAGAVGLERCSVLAVGKAAAPMAGAAVRVLDRRVDRIVGVGPLGRQAAVPSGAPGGEPIWLDADHPTPSQRNVEAARRVRAFVGSLGPGETLLVLLSGGASAMLCLPRHPLALGEIATLTDALLRAGAPIGELNAIRKHCEVLKGGGLAAVCGAGRIVTLVLSDVLGDRLDVIGSGPTAPDPSTFADALAVLNRRGLHEASPAATALLERGAAGGEPETVKPDDPLWGRVENRVIGNNLLALDGAVAACERAGFAVRNRREGVEGEAAEVGRALARAATQMPGEAPAAIVWGGETTVTVGDAPGLGGRNQELALAAALELDGVPGATVLSLATDGRDGPTDAAGGLVDGGTAAAIRAAGVDPRAALADHDSYRALDAARALVRTGATGTNVNDVMVALIDARCERTNHPAC